MPDASPRIFVAYTGGTIGMKNTTDGYVPASGYLQERMAALPPFQAEEVPAYTVYATGRALAEAGVVSGYDMTTEAALAKLYYLFERGLPPETVRARVQQNLRGELTPPEDVPPALGRARRRLARYR